jgi:HD-like signal output (HDOD) protein
VSLVNGRRRVVPQPFWLEASSAWQHRLLSRSTNNRQRTPRAIPLHRSNPFCRLTGGIVTTEHRPTFVLDRVLSRIDRLATQRPVAARIVAATDAEGTDARTLAGLLLADMALSGRVMKLANSAYYGMRGRVSSLQMAVTVVGFTTVRTMATTALTELDDESQLPEDFWTITTRLAIAASRLAPKFAERAADALCLGLLAPLGSALVYHAEPDEYGQLLADEPTFAGRRRAERARYGMTMVDVTAVALESWGFPLSVLTPLQRLEDRASVAGGLLRGAYEVVSRLTLDGHKPLPIGPLTAGRVRDDDLPPVLYEVRNEADDLRQLLFGEA